MTMRKIIVYTVAYNAEKTLQRTINSILAQTYDNWMHYCVDNGSNDCTSAIIRDYAAKDSRIIHFVNKENHAWEQGNTWSDIIKQHSETDFFCWLDADDEYKPDFFEKMLLFIEKSNLDIAACGNDFVDVRTDEAEKVRKLNKDIILEGDGFSEYLSTYHQFMRTFWAKLYSIAVLRRIDFNRVPSIP